MKRRTLLALAVAGVLGSSAASAATYVCQTDPSDVSFKACAEMTSDSISSTQYYVLMPEPARVAVAPAPTTYYFVEPAAARVVPSRTITT